MKADRWCPPAPRHQIPATRPGLPFHLYRAGLQEVNSDKKHYLRSGRSLLSITRPALLAGVWSCQDQGLIQCMRKSTEISGPTIRTRFRSQPSTGKNPPLLLAYPAIPERMQGQKSAFRPLLTPNFHAQLRNPVNQGASESKNTL